MESLFSEVQNPLPGGLEDVELLSRAIGQWLSDGLAINLRDHHTPSSCIHHYRGRNNIYHEVAVQKVQQSEKVQMRARRGRFQING